MGCRKRASCFVSQVRPSAHDTGPVFYVEHKIDRFVKQKLSNDEMRFRRDLQSYRTGHREAKRYTHPPHKSVQDRQGGLPQTFRLVRLQERDPSLDKHAKSEQKNIASPCFGWKKNRTEPGERWAVLLVAFGSAEPNPAKSP